MIAVYLDYEREPPQSRITTQITGATAVPPKRLIFLILTRFGIEISSPFVVKKQISRAVVRNFTQFNLEFCDINRLS